MFGITYSWAYSGRHHIRRDVDPVAVIQAFEKQNIGSVQNDALSKRKLYTLLGLIRKPAYSNAPTSRAACALARLEVLLCPQDKYVSTNLS